MSAQTSAIRSDSGVRIREIAQLIPKSGQPC